MNGLARRHRRSYRRHRPCYSGAWNRKLSPTCRWATLENRDEAEAAETGIRSYYGEPQLDLLGSVASDATDRYSQVDLLLAEIIEQSQIARA